MKKYNSNQHVQVPHLEEGECGIKPKDQLIYACIRRYMNKDTKQAFPSLETLKQDSGASIPTIRKSIKTLENYDYLKVSKKKGPNGKLQNIYNINVDKCKHFEKFSFEFLDNSNIDFTQKSYILASQQFMIKSNNMGKISYSNKELSTRINMPESTISKCNRELVKKDYMLIIKNAKQRDFIDNGGCKTEVKVFDLPKLGQALVFAAIDHENRITNNEETIQYLLKQNKEQAKDIAMLKRYIEETTKHEQIKLTL